MQNEISAIVPQTTTLSPFLYPARSPMRVKSSALGAESLAFDTFISEFTLVTAHHSAVGLSLAHC
jgi:hypothetical protein